MDSKQFAGVSPFFGVLCRAVFFLFPFLGPWTLPHFLLICVSLYIQADTIIHITETALPPQSAGPGSTATAMVNDQQTRLGTASVVVDCKDLLPRL